MSKEHHWQPRLFRRYTAVNLPEIFNAGTPSTALGKEAKLILRSRGAPVAAMVIRVNDISLTIECIGQSRIPSAMLGQTVCDLHNGLGVTPRKPAMYEYLCAIQRTNAQVGLLCHVS